MNAFVVSLVVASAVLCHGFVKGGYGEQDSSRSVTYVNRIIPDQVQVNQGSSTRPSVSVNVNGAHTLAGEAVLHHVMYHNNGVPVVTTFNGGALNEGTFDGGAINGGPVNGGHYHGGYTQLLHLQNGGRPLNGGGMVFPAGGADIFPHFLNPNGIQDNRHVHFISGQPLPHNHHFGHHISQLNLEGRTRKPDDRRLSGMATLASITSQMSGMDDPSTKTV